MRLHEIYQICLDSYSQLECIKFNKYNDKFYNVENLRLFQETLDTLSELEFLKPYIIDAYKVESVLVVRTTKYVQADDEQRRKILHIKEKLKDKLITIIELCESLGYEEGNTGFNVKMPIKSDFAEFSKCVNNFNIVLSQCPYLSVNDASIELKKLDVGSAWLEFCVKGSMALALLTSLATLTDKAIMLHSHILTCQQQELNYRKMELDEKLINNMLEVHDKATQLYMDRLIDEIEGSSELEPEERSRAVLTLDTLSKLISQGLEIHDAINTSQNNNELLFPTSDQWQYVLEGNTIKFLEDYKQESLKSISDDLSKK